VIAESSPVGGNCVLVLVDARGFAFGAGSARAAAVVAAVVAVEVEVGGCDGAAAGGAAVVGAWLEIGVGNGGVAYPPTSAMKRFADSLARQKGIKPRRLQDVDLDLP